MISENTKEPEQDLWKAHSEAWKVSGLTQMAYCVQHDLRYERFIYQHSLLMKQAKRAAVNFVEAKLTKTTSNTQNTGLQLILPNGIRVGITNEVNATFLKTVLAIAGALQC